MIFQDDLRVLTVQDEWFLNAIDVPQCSMSFIMLDAQNQVSICVHMQDFSTFERLRNILNNTPYQSLESPLLDIRMHVASDTLIIYTHQ